MVKKNAVMKWDEQMEKEAAVAAKIEEGVGGGNFFSLKSGTLSWMDSPMPDNEMVVVILDGVIENVFYEGRYDPDNPGSPICYAFGRDAKEMKPHENVAEPCNDKCGEHGNPGCCPKNEFGTSDTGKGKACKNVRRLALIPAGNIKDGNIEFNTDEEHYKTVGEGFLKVPVMSVPGSTGYSSLVKKVAASLKRPPYGIFTKIKVVPDDKSQFRVLFEALDILPDNLLPIVSKRHAEIAKLIDFPYQAVEEEPKKKSKRNNKY